MADPLFSLGTRRTAETLREALIPMGAVGGTWFVARRLLATPTASRELAPIELAVMLGAIAAIVSWYSARQLNIIGSRRPWRLVFGSWLMVTVMMLLVSRSVQVRFDDQCREIEGAVPIDSHMLMEEAPRLCQVNAVAGNSYMPGTVLRAPWNGKLSVPMVLYLAIVSMLTTLGLRDRRLFRTRMGLNIAQMLRFAPSGGSETAAGGKPNLGLVQACANATLWGEQCGQIYPVEKKFEDGEWCVRCAQVYRRCERQLEFSVVSLFTNEVDVLNGLERLDAISWPQGEPMPPDPRLSGQERWARLGKIKVPDVISVTTMLALVQEALPGWLGDAEPADEHAFQLAIDKASRISAWVWFGRHEATLTHARPTSRALLISGPSRLRDLSLERGEELVLQLDIGLLPLELRTGFRQTFLDEERNAIVNNSKQDIWIPVAGGEAIEGGLWVPRLEGKALRTWLSLDRMRPSDVLGVTTPLPYLPPGRQPVAKSVRPGSLDLVRMPLDDDRAEPILVRRPGDSIAEWAWMEWKLLELLRTESLVMVSR